MSLADLLCSLPGHGNHQSALLKSEDTCPNLYVQIWYDPLVSKTWGGSIHYGGTTYAIVSMEGRDREGLFLDLEAALLKQFPWTRAILYPDSLKTALERILEEEEPFR